MKRKELPSFEVLNKLLMYDQQSGELIWKQNPERGPRTIGRIAGNIDSRTGYARVKINGRLILSHLIAWVLMTGGPPPHLIDHIDRNRSNNSWSNLREATASQNRINGGKYKSNKSGFRGVFETPNNKFTAAVSCNGTRIYLGTFESSEKAAIAYGQAASKLYGGYYSV